MSIDDIDIQFFKELIKTKYAEAMSAGISGFSVKCFFQREHPEFYKFISETYSGNFGQKLFLFAHDLTEPPKCQFCHEHDAKWYGFVRGFGKWCSMGCMNKDSSHRSKMEGTMLKKYGKPHALQVKEFNDKFRNTIGNKETKPGRFVKSLKRRMKTCKEKYGVENVMLFKDVVAHQHEVIKEKYGVEYATQNEAIKEKARNTRAKKVKDNPNYWKERQSKTEATFLKKYGTTNPQRDLCLGLDKRQDTCRKRYGVDWFAQSHECHKNRRKHIACDGLTFDSAWEKLVYQFCQEHDLPCEYQPEVSFEYECDGGIHVYQPDFRINGVLYEVKGDHFFRINESTGEEEMFLPFKGRGMSDEEYRHRCNVFNAKYKCMRDHGVKLLRGKEIANLERVLLK